MENNILKKISKLIIDKRLIVFIAFAAGAYLLLRRKKKRAAPAESGEQAE